MTNRQPNELERMGQAGLEFVKQFEMRRVLEAFVKELEKVVEETSGSSKAGHQDVSDPKAPKN